MRASMAKAFAKQTDNEFMQAYQGRRMGLNVVA